MEISSLSCGHDLLNHKDQVLSCSNGGRKNEKHDEEGERDTSMTVPSLFFCCTGTISTM